MLTDIFGVIDFQKQPQHRFSFQELPFYQQKDIVQKKHSGEFYDFTCNYKHESNLDHFQSAQVEVFILGYCLSRSTARFVNTKSRLNAEDIGKLYREKGTDFTREIKGSFVIVLVDISHQSIYLAADPLNVRQVYLERNGNSLTFSSSLNALIRNRQQQKIPVNLNYSGLVSYYLFDYILDDSSFIEGIDVLPAGNLLQSNRNGIKLVSYFDPHREFVPESAYSEKESLELLEQILQYNLETHLHRSGEPAVALTGGYDSRLNLALLSPSAGNYSYYSYGKEGSYDLEIPRQIAAELKLDYQSFYIDEDYEKNIPAYADQAAFWGDGFAETSKANFVFPFSRLANDTDQILTGLFGSELIKQPTSNGLFIDCNTRSLLGSTEKEVELDHIFENAAQQNYLQKDVLESCKNKVKCLATSILILTFPWHNVIFISS